MANVRWIMLGAAGTILIAATIVGHYIGDLIDNPISTYAPIPSQWDN